ncbi:MAG: hypothetical protein ABIA67_00990 [Candidatus Margulisiibacteriota bacterium]
MGLESLSQQNAAVIANLSSANEMNQVLRSELEREIDSDNSTKVQESAVKKALNGNRAEAGTQILAGLAAKLAKQVTPSRLLGNLQEEYGFVLDGQEEGVNDSIDISHQITRAAKLRYQNRQNQHGMANAEEGAQEGKSADVKEYIGAYSQMLVNGGAEAKKKMDALEDRLLNEKSISLKDLKGLKVQVANSVRGEIARQIKNSYLKQVLAQTNSIESLIAKKETQGNIFFGESKAKLGGFGFGGYHGNMQGTVDAAKRDVGELLKDFVDDALTGELMKQVISKDEGEGKKAIEELLELGKKIGFDAQEFVNKLPKLKEHLGLNPVISFEYAGAGADANSDQREQHHYQYTAEEEKDVLTDKLRALYMRRAVHGDMRTVLETQFKMIKTKNGLIKLGVKNFDQVQVEGKACAKIKLLNMLQEAFEERATYAKLKGEAWQMTERKIKTVLRNLENLGIQLTQIELEQIRDKANDKMFREAEHEFTLINTAIEAQGEIAYLTNKRMTVAGILERLAEESNFQAPGHEIELSVREAC